MFRHGFRACKRLAPRTLFGVLNLVLRVFEIYAKSFLEGISNYLASLALGRSIYSSSSYMCCIWENVFEHLDVSKISQQSGPTTAAALIQCKKNLKLPPCKVVTVALPTHFRDATCQCEGELPKFTDFQTGVLLD